MKKIILVLLSALILSLSGCAVPTYEAKVYESYDELSTKPNNWGFVRKEKMPPQIDNGQKELLEAYNGYYLDHSEEKTLYLTFDEGYENGYTSKILDTLLKEDVKAAFFVTGPYLLNQTELIKRMVSEGHIVGNHTVNHINMSTSGEDEIKTELNSLNESAKELYGIEMKYVRPPEGSFSEKSLAISKDLGYKTILWSFAYADWDINNQKGRDHAFKSVTPYLHDGAILLLHAVSSDNAEALGDIISYAKSEGYTFKSLDELK